jgi:uncharacterized protein YegL
MPSPFPSLPTALSLALATAMATGQDAQSNFGHARARELAELGRLPTAHDIVVRDMVNYHHHQLPLPRADQDVALDLRFDRSYGDSEREVVLQVGYTTRPQGDRTFAPPCTVALVVDCSGSMQERGKMDQVKQGLREFAGTLRPEDEVALVAFSTEARVLARRRPYGDGRWLLSSIEELQPSGNTNLHAGLMAGLRELRGEDQGNRSQRVILLTDGIANTGVTEPAQIVADTKPFTSQSIDISTIGLGENLDVPLLEGISRGTRGLFHFVGDGREVQKVFVQEADSLLLASARRPHLTVHLPRELQVERIFHEGVQQTGDDLQLDLPDLNAGATGVVIVRCRLAPRAYEPVTVRAELSFGSATTKHQETVTTQTTLRMRSPGSDQATRSQVDLDVQKNYAIAVLAQGLADMARACDAKRWADADRALRLAQEDSQRLFPGDEPDLQRMREIAQGHARTLRRYVDRFRDY